MRDRGGAGSDLAALLKEDRLIVLAGSHDALSARLAERQGFDAVWVSSFGVTNTLGLVDEGVITLSEMMATAWRIKRSISCPVIVDCDTGYGQAINVRRLAGEARERRLDAICLEDQAFPKRNTFLDGEHQLEDCKQFCEKVSAAVAGNDSDQCLVIARTEALAQGRSVAAALERAHLYAEAGADAIVIQSRAPDMEALVSFASGWEAPQPLGVITTSIPGFGFDEMQQAGFRFAIYANQGLRSAVRAMTSTYASIFNRDGQQSPELALASLEEVLQLQSDFGRG